MDIFFDQYFDFDIMRDNFSYVLDGFWLTIQLALVSGRARAGLGTGARPAAGSARPRDAAGARGHDRLHRRVPGHSAAARDPADRRQPAGARRVAEWLRAPDFLGKPEIFWYGVMAITLTYGAYYAEVYRAGLDAVPYGQMEAARSLGMSHAKAMRHVIVPQAIRKVIPPMLNDFIALMKDTSLVGVIALVEVVKAGREIQAETFNSSALTLGALMFIVVTIPLARLVDRLIARQQLAMRRGTPNSAERWNRSVGASAADASPRGRAQELRRPARAARRRPGGRARRRGLRDRPERLAARARCCAASTCSSRRTAAGSSSRARRSPAAARADVDFVRRRVGMVFQQFNLFPHMTAWPNVSLAQRTVLGPLRGGGPTPRAGRCWSASALDGQGGRVPGAAVRRPAAARRDRARAGDGPARDALRRGHQRARPRAREGGARRDARAGRRGHDDGRGHPRDGLRRARSPTGSCSWTRA